MLLLLLLLLRYEAAVYEYVDAPTTSVSLPY